MKQKAEAIRPRLLTFGTNVLLAKPCDKAEKMRHLFYKLEFDDSFFGINQGNLQTSLYHVGISSSK